MESTAMRQVHVLGRAAQVELCACGGGLTLRIGPVALRLDLAAAGDVACTIAQALEVAAKIAAGIGADRRGIEEGGRN